MLSPILLVGLLGVLGLIVGAVLATVTVRLPREDGDAVAFDPEVVLSKRYLVMQAAGAGVGVWAALSGSSGLVVAATAVLGWQLLLIAVVDAEHFWLPDVLTWPLAASGLFVAAAMLRDVPWASLIGIGIGFFGLWAVAWLYRRLRRRDGLGEGDPFLLGAAGAWVGWTGLPSVMMTACAVGLGLVLLRLLFRRPVRVDDRMPFGTFLAIAVWLTWLVQRAG